MERTIRGTLDTVMPLPLHYTLHTLHLVLDLSHLDADLALLAEADVVAQTGGEYIETHASRGHFLCSKV
jgi:hypothetical protein